MKNATSQLSATLWNNPNQYSANLISISASGGPVWNWTSGDTDVVSGSTTWYSNQMRFEADKLRSSTGIEIDGIELTVLHGDAQLSGTTESVPSYVLSGNLDGAIVSYSRLYSTLSTSDVSSSGGIVPLFSGTINEATPKSTQTLFKVVSSINDLKLDFPRRTIQERCPYAFGDKSCQVTVGTFNATEKTVNGTGSTTSRVVGEVPPGYNIHVYPSATLTFTSGPLSGLTRTVTVVQDLVAGDNPPAPGYGNFYATYTPVTDTSASVGNTFTLRQGCPKTRDVCKTLYNNMARFGGFPDAPFKGNQYNAIIGTKRVRHWSRGFLNIGGHAYYSNEPIYGAPEGSARLIGEQLGSVMPVVYGTAKCPTTFVFDSTCSFTASVELDPYNAPGVFTDLATSAYGTVLAVCEAPVTGFNAFYVNASTTASAIGSIFTPQTNYWRSGAISPSPAQYDIITGSSTPWIYYNTVYGSGTQLSGTAHSGTAHIRGIGLVRANDTIPSIMVDVRGRCIASSSTNIIGVKEAYGLSIQWDMPATGAFPPLVVKDILTHPRFGYNFPTSSIEVALDLSGTVYGSYERYCNAEHSQGTNKLYGLTVSRVLDNANSGDGVLQELLEATNAQLVYSRGKIFVIPDGKDYIYQTQYTNTIYLSPPFGDPVTYTKTFPYWVPPSASVHVINEDDLIREGSSDPIEVKRAPDSDVFNTIQVKFKNMFADDKDSVVEYTDVADADVRGIRRKQVTNNWITNPNQAQWLSKKLVDKSLNNRNSFTFILGPRWALIEPTDILILSDTVTGISNIPVRVNVIEERENGKIRVVATEWQI